MQNLKLRILQKEDLECIKPLICCCDFSDYKFYHVFKKDILERYIFEQVSELLNEGGWIIVAEGREKIEGLVSLGRLSWGKEIFGIEMAELKHLISYGTYAYKREIMTFLLSYVFQLCREGGIEHLSCKVNTIDFPVIHCLETMGFEIMETQVTYLYTRQRVPKLKDLYRIRPFKEEDLEVLINIVRGVFTKSRFYTDPHIPDDRVDEFYIRWLNGCAKGLLADKIFVAERKSKAVGFLTYKVNWELARLSGFKIGGQGLSAVSFQTKGAYLALMKALIQENISLLDFGEFDTQLNNYEVIRIWQKFGLDFVRSKYTFHKWLRS